MNQHKESETFFNIRIHETPDKKESFHTIAVEEEAIAKVVARSLKDKGYKVTLTKFVKKKTERLLWRDVHF